MSEHTQETVTLNAIMSRHIPRDGGECRITIRIKNPGGLCNSQTVDAVGANFGFDWEHGQLIIEPAVPLTKLTQEQLADITESVRKGQSWHSYQDHKRQANERRKLITERDELLAVLEGVLAVVGDSAGVAGYHLNGDIADWGEFDEINAVYTAIAKAKGNTQQK